MENTIKTIIRKYCSRNSFHIEYGGYLFNHFSHGVIALHKLGSPINRLESFCESYTNHTTLGAKLELPRYNDRFKISNDEEFFNIKGKKINYLGTIDYLSDQLKNKFNNDKTKLLQHYVPKLYDGLSATVLHPFISLGYSIDYELGDNTSDSELIIDALAYLNFSNYSIGFPNYSKDVIKGNNNTISSEDLNFKSNNNNNNITNEKFHKIGLDLKSIFLEVRKNGRLTELLNKNYNPNLFDHKIVGEIDQKIMVLVQFAADEIEKTVSTLIQNKQFLFNSIQNNWKELYTFLYDTYFSIYSLSGEKSKGDDFFILHLVTSFWALGRISTILTQEQKLDLLITYIKVTVVLYVIQKCPDFDNNQDNYAFNLSSNSSNDDKIIPSWDEMKNYLFYGEGKKIEEEHDIKIVYSAIDRFRNDKKFSDVCEEKDGIIKSDDQIKKDKFLRLVAARKLLMLKW